MKFLPYELNDFSEVKHILDRAFDDTNQSDNFSVLGRIEDSKNYSRFVVKDDNKLIAYLGYAHRTIRYLGEFFTAASIGPVVVSASAQKNGIGSFLMREALKHIERSGIEIAYIQGIPDYYQRFGFTKYLDKSKRVISTDADIEVDVSTISIVKDTTNIDAYRQLYDQYSRSVNSAAKRNQEDWSWLLGPASTTYYFFEPRLIKDVTGQAIGYFCDDPKVTNSPREIVFSEDPGSLQQALEAVKHFYKKKGCQTLDIKAPEHSKVAQQLDATRCEKVTYVNPRGGDLMLVFDQKSVATKLSASVAALLDSITMDFSATLRFHSFAFELGIANGLPYTKIEDSTEESNLDIAHFLSGRIDSSLLENTSTTGFSSYDALQKILFPKQTGFVFQGDNM